MRELSVAASLFSAVVLAVAPGSAARAADLSEPPQGYDQEYNEGYDDGRGAYDDNYAEDDRAPPPPGYADRYADRDDGRYDRRDDGRDDDERDRAPPPGDEDDEAYAGNPPPGSIKDGYPVPVEPPRYGNRAPERYDRVPGRSDRFACLEPYQIARRLQARGWIDVRPMGGREGIVRVQAHRPDSSSAFMLRVDRCSGEVVWSRPMRTYAYAPRPWQRWNNRWGY